MQQQGMTQERKQKNEQLEKNKRILQQKQQNQSKVEDQKAHFERTRFKRLQGRYTKLLYQNQQLKATVQYWKRLLKTQLHPLKNKMTNKKNRETVEKAYIQEIQRSKNCIAQTSGESGITDSMQILRATLKNVQQNYEALTKVYKEKVKAFTHQIQQLNYENGILKQQKKELDEKFKGLK